LRAEGKAAVGRRHCDGTACPATLMPTRPRALGGPSGRLKQADIDAVGFREQSVGLPVIHRAVSGVT